MTNDHQIQIVDDKDKFFDFITDIKSSVSIHSSLSVPLVVRQRTGVNVVMRPRHNGGYQTEQITIQLELMAKADVFININPQSMESLPEEYQILYQAIQTMRDKGTVVGGYYMARISLTYSKAFFERHGGEFYSAIADVVLSLHPLEAAALHPYSVDTIQRHQSQRLQDDFEGLVLYAVRLVDRFDQLGPRYMNIAGDVFRIDPEPLDHLTEQMEDGLHFLGTQPMRNAKDVKKDARATFIPMATLLKDPTKHGLWSTFGEARHQGNKELQTAQNALEVALKTVEKKDRLVENLKRELDEAKQKQKQEGSLVMHKGITELIKLATAMVGIVKLLK